MNRPNSVPQSKPLEAFILADVSPHAVIHALILLGLRTFDERPQVEVAADAGVRYAREDGRTDIVPPGGAAPLRVYGSSLCAMRRRTTAVNAVSGTNGRPRSAVRAKRSGLFAAGRLRPLSRSRSSIRPKALTEQRREIQLVNSPAVATLEKGLDETRSLHQLAVSRELGTSVKNAHLRELVNARLWALRRTVTTCQTRNLRLRWYAVALYVRFRHIKHH